MTPPPFSSPSSFISSSPSSSDSSSPLLATPGSSQGDASIVDTDGVQTHEEDNMTLSKRDGKRRAGADETVGGLGKRVCLGKGPLPEV